MDMIKRHSPQSMREPEITTYAAKRCCGKKRPVKLCKTPQCVGVALLSITKKEAQHILYFILLVRMSP